MHVCYRGRTGNLVRWSRVRGGVTFFRSGGGAAARAYLEADHSRADDYYLAEGAGLADRVVFDRAGQVVATQQLDGDGYEAWAEWRDPVTGERRGVPRVKTELDPVSGKRMVTASSPLFAEMTVNIDKTLSLAAAVNPEVSAALDRAQRDAAEAMSSYMAEHSKTRVGPKGAQRLVPVERLEAAMIRHETSRAGDPHRHLHLQWSTRVFAEGKWRALDTATTLRQQGALRGVGEAVINAHPELRAELARAGFTFDLTSGRVVEMEPYAAQMSKRAVQVQANRERLETLWRETHPDVVPGPVVVRSWDRQAWALDRPGKKLTELSSTDRWRAELTDAGYRAPSRMVAPESVSIAHLDRDQIAELVVDRLGSQRSAWSVADLHDQVAHHLAGAGIVARRQTLSELVDDITARAQTHCTTITADLEVRMPDTVRHLTSSRVIDSDRELADHIAARAQHPGTRRTLPATLTVDGRVLGDAQRAAVAVLTGTQMVAVIEGAAGSGKTTALKAAKELLEADGRTLMVVAPTLKAAKEAQAATGADASSLHKLLHEHGYRWPAAGGTWTRLQVGEVDPGTGKPYQGPKDAFRLSEQTMLVIDEAGMVDKDAAGALARLVDETSTPYVVQGDRAQLPTVGRGGVMDTMVRHADVVVDIEEVHRFRLPDGSVDAEYAALSLQMRRREASGEVFDRLVARGLVRVHASETAALEAIAGDATAATLERRSVAVSLPTNETATEVNKAIRDARVNAGLTATGTGATTGVDGNLISRGDVIMTRRNDTTADVANRELFTVTQVLPGGGLIVADDHRARHTLTPEYVAEHVHLGYAVTEYGNQGGTADKAAMLLSESTTAAGVYVPMTRGRDENVLHVVAATEADARAMWIEAMEREAGDRGLEHAREQAAGQVQGLDLSDDPRTVQAQRVAEILTRDVDGLTPLDERFRAEMLGRFGKITDRAEQYRAVFDEAAERELRKGDWVAAGNPALQEFRQGVAVAETAAKDAAAAQQIAEQQEQDRIYGLRLVAGGQATRDEQRLRAAERAVEDANVFTRPRARSELEQLRTDLTDQYGTDQAHTWRMVAMDRVEHDAMADPPTTLVEARSQAAATEAAAETALRYEQQLHQRWATTVLQLPPLPESAPDQGADRLAAIERAEVQQRREVERAEQRLPSAQQQEDGWAGWFDRYDAAEPARRVRMELAVRDQQLTQPASVQEHQRQLSEYAVRAAAMRTEYLHAQVEQAQAAMPKVDREAQNAATAEQMRAAGDRDAFSMPASAFIEQVADDLTRAQNSGAGEFEWQQVARRHQEHQQRLQQQRAEQQRLEQERQRSASYSSYGYGGRDRGGPSLGR